MIPRREAFRDDVLAGLSAPIPAIPARWLYDRRGSELFDEITPAARLIIRRGPRPRFFHDIMPEIAARVPKGAAVVEFGAGSATKTPILLEAIAPAAYVPVDISGDYLEQSAAELQQRFPRLEVIPVVADFARPFTLAGRDRSICPSSASSPARPSAISCRAARPTCCASSARCSAPARSC